MSLSLMQHQLEPEAGSKGIEFHRDDSDYAMVVLLDDPHDKDLGWKGGELTFRLVDSHVFQNTLTPEQGHGILFSNHGIRHAVNPLQATEKIGGARTILVLHDYGPTDTSKKIERKLIFFSIFVHIVASNIFRNINFFYYKLRTF